VPRPTIAWMEVEVKILDVDFQSYACPRCGAESPRHDGAVRHVIDVGLERATVLQIQVGVYKCPRCRNPRSFRTPLDFLKPRRTYVERCRQKLDEAVSLDQLPITLAVQRLDRDFHIRISRSTGWVWHQAAAPIPAEVAEYQHLVAASFSGVLCVDEVYDGQYAILCARDPLTNRTLAYELSETMNQEVVTAFFRKLRDLGIEPEVVVTDDSNLYPKALKAVWAFVRHQLCRFHWTKNIVQEVLGGIRNYRESLPKPPKRAKRGRPAAREAAAQQQVAASRAARDEVRKGRTLLVTRREHLDDQRKERLELLLANHPDLVVVRNFMDEFYGLFNGQPRPKVAKARWQALIGQPDYTASPILTGALQILQDEAKFDQVALFLQFENLNSTSNDVERDNRGFRKAQKTRYRVRSKGSLQALLDRRLIRAGPPTQKVRLRRRVGRPSRIMSQAA